jgi:hypothetical protein
MAKRDPEIGDDVGREISNAAREAADADRVEPRARAARYDRQAGLVLIDLRSGYTFGFPPERLPGLDGATAEQLSAVRISPSGDGLHWDGLDVDVSLTGLVAAGLNLDSWAPRWMGQLRSEAKARAARANGVRGGRPRRAGRRGTPKK